jgi:hypothetical protein
MPPKRRRRNRSSSSIPPDTIDEILRKIREQKENIVREFHSLDNCNNLYNKWRYKKRRDDVKDLKHDMHERNWKQS